MRSRKILYWLMKKWKKWKKRQSWKSRRRAKAKGEGNNCRRCHFGMYEEIRLVASLYCYYWFPSVCCLFKLPSANHRAREKNFSFTVCQDSCLSYSRQQSIALCSLLSVEHCLLLSLLAAMPLHTFWIITMIETKYVQGEIFFINWVFFLSESGGVGVTTQTER